MRMSFFFYNMRCSTVDFVAFWYRIFEICIFVRNIYMLTRYFYNDIFITGLDVKIYVIGGKICISQKRENF